MFQPGSFHYNSVKAQFKLQRRTGVKTLGMCVKSGHQESQVVTPDRDEGRLRTRAKEFIESDQKCPTLGEAIGPQHRFNSLQMCCREDGEGMLVTYDLFEGSVNGERLLKTLQK